MENMRIRNIKLNVLRDEPHEDPILHHLYGPMEQQGTGSWILSRKTQFLLLLSFSLGCLYINLQVNFPQIPQCPCGDCHTNDSWFSARFNASYHPLMTRNISNVSPDTFQWWKRMQRTRSGWDEYKRAVDEIFQIIPDKEMYMDAGPERCRVCSVVGNSGNLKNSHYGPMIDNGDFVFRINRGPTEGYEQNVGTKTTHRIIYPESAVDVDNSTHLVFFAFKMLDLKWLVSVFTTHTITRAHIPVKSSIRANISLVMLVSPSFMKYVHHKWLQKHGQYPSTGFMTLIMALHICDKVRVFGFGADKDGNWNHYFETIKPNYRTGIHRGHFEYATIKELQKRSKIELYG
ncbi:CMP-N-acetylneuraminate-beta-galactosamide-alpha-2,3-sialyltransferase 1-like [Engraulis encrasicolus]|uniref:CMP-N-acetylneuraminate-beta-galactosamide- alpha-2,3-sialyltransferase 1-like n=1 Tax=Engraulis encrasicolus TaxID=184585 RepID=UPI002FD108F9